MTTAAEKRHMAAVARIGCIVCRGLGYGHSPAELHHPRSLAGMGQKARNMDVIPLCYLHHRGGGYGVAFHDGKEAWEANFGTESELLEKVRELLS